MIAGLKGSNAMPYPQAVNQALDKLATTGIWRGNYAPPLYRLLWRAGCNVPPPHYAGFMRNFLFNGIWFACVWGAIMWFAVWPQSGISGLHALLLAAIAGAVFGLAMAFYYRHGARKYQLLP
ncbi:MAG: DUF6404 family protein [Collimonas pratensis]|uniref:DUF6404 family protein n=1 Tax=Collimonas pratensis TaxID=279113 RepID=UPI003C747A1F